MVETYLLNALGEFFIAFSALYAAYVVKKHRNLAKYFILISLVFFITAAFFVKGSTGEEFFLFTMISWLVFSIAFVEATAKMIDDYEPIRNTYVLYLLLFIFAFFPNFEQVVVYRISIFISHLIIITCLISLILMKSGRARLFSFIGLLGIAIPIFIGILDFGVAVAPWNYNLLPEKILIALFFIGFGFCTKKEPYCFCDHKLLKRKRK